MDTIYCVNINTNVDISTATIERAVITLIRDSGYNYSHLSVSVTKDAPQDMTTESIKVDDAKYGRVIVEALLTLSGEVGSLPRETIYRRILSIARRLES